MWFFNSRVISFLDCPDDVNIKTDNFEYATIIISTNHIWEAINIKKTITNYAETDKLTICITLDSVNFQIVSSPSHEELLKLDFSCMFVWNLWNLLNILKYDNHSSYDQYFYKKLSDF